MSKMCTLCGSTDVIPYGNNLLGEPMLMCNNCKEPGVVSKFEDCTVFHQITASPEVLAPKLVYWTLIEYHGKIHAHWMSTITGEVIYDSEPEAIAATVAKLKEVEK